MLALLSKRNKDVVNDIFPLIYAEMKKPAGNYLRNERSNHTLQPTPLVHEAYIKLVDLIGEWQRRGSPMRLKISFFEYFFYRLKKFLSQTMNPERWKQIEEIFQVALGLNGDEREKFVRAECGDDAQLRAEVEKYISRFETEDSFLESPVWTDSRFLQSQVKKEIASSLELAASAKGAPSISKQNKTVSPEAETVAQAIEPPLARRAQIHFFIHLYSSLTLNIELPDC